MMAVKAVFSATLFLFSTSEKNVTPSPLHLFTLLHSLLGDLPPGRLHARRHAGEIPNLVSRNCTFLCELPQLVDSPARVQLGGEGHLLGRLGHSTPPHPPAPPPKP